MAVENVGLQIYTITCDLGAENRALLKHLEVTPEKTWIRNPFDEERKVYVFADVPHMLKLIRNHVIDDGVLLSDNTLVNRKTLETLLENNGKELKLHPNFSQKSLELNGPERMRVRDAAQLLSNRMATLAKRTFPEKPSVARFFTIINEGFDILNSRIPKDPKNNLKSGFGLLEKIQTKKLEELADLIGSMRFQRIGKDGKEISKLPLPCQLGFLISISSLTQLFKDLRKNLNVTYILTSHLNQDCLESFFSKIRSIGGPNSNPCASEFRYRYRMVLLGSCCRAPKNTNSLFDEDDYISAELIEKNDLFCESETLTSESDIEIPEDENLQLIENTNIENESLKYLAGYIAWQLKRQGKGIFGTPSSHVFNISAIKDSWIHMLSRGGLLFPSDEIYNATLHFNQIFERNIDRLWTQKDIFKKMYTVIKASQSGKVLDSWILEFVKVRLNIRLKYLNSSKVLSGVNTKKRKHFHKARCVKTLKVDKCYVKNNE